MANTTFTAGATGNWSDTTKWSGGAIPGSGDTVTIGAGANVTMDVSYTCTTGSVNFATGGGCTFTQNHGTTLTINGGAWLNTGNSNNNTVTYHGDVEFTSGTFYGINSPGACTWATDSTCTINASTGTFYMACGNGGSLTFLLASDSSASAINIENIPASAILVNNASSSSSLSWTGNITVSASPSHLYFNGTSANLALSGQYVQSGAAGVNTSYVSQSGGINITGILTISAGSFSIGTTTVAGTPVNTIAAGALITVSGGSFYFNCSNSTSSSTVMSGGAISCTSGAVILTNVSNTTLINQTFSGGSVSATGTSASITLINTNASSLVMFSGTNFSVSSGAALDIQLSAFTYSAGTFSYGSSISIQPSSAVSALTAFAATLNSSGQLQFGSFATSYNELDANVYYETGTGTTPAVADEYVVAGLYKISNNQSTVIFQGKNTGLYEWSDGSRYYNTSTAPGAAFPAGYFRTAVGGSVTSTHTAVGTATGTFVLQQNQRVIPLSYDAGVYDWSRGTTYGWTTTIDGGFIMLSVDGNTPLPITVSADFTAFGDETITADGSVTLESYVGFPQLPPQGTGGYLKALTDGGASIAAANALTAALTAITNAINALQSLSARSGPKIPSTFVIPSSGTATYEFLIYFWDLNGEPQAPDAAPTVHCKDSAGNSLDAKLSSVTMTAVSGYTNVFSGTYTVSAGDPQDAAYFAFAWTVASVAMNDAGAASIVTIDNLTAINDIQTKVDSIAAGGTVVRSDDRNGNQIAGYTQLGSIGTNVGNSATTIAAVLTAVNSLPNVSAIVTAMGNLVLSEFTTPGTAGYQWAQIGSGDDSGGGDQEQSVIIEAGGGVSAQ